MHVGPCILKFLCSKTMILQEREKLDKRFFMVHTLHVSSEILPSTPSGFVMASESSLSLSACDSTVSSITLACSGKVIEERNRIDHKFEEEVSMSMPRNKSFVSVLVLADCVSAATLSEFLPSTLFSFSIALVASLSVRSILVYIILC